MPSFSVAWLEQGRIAAQSAWFGAFGAALWVTIWAFQGSLAPGRARLARVGWAIAIALLVAMWLAGATLEMVRRAAPVSGGQMTVALGAFSLLVAGVISLARDWFGQELRAPLRADKIALSLLILTFAGWWLGGLALEFNALWFLRSSSLSRGPMPDAWALLLGGATLLGASREVASSDETRWRVHNPRLATWWLASIALFLSLPSGAQNPGAAGVFALASGVFGLKIWRVRHDCPHFLRAPLGARVIGLLGLAILPLIWHTEWRAFWKQNLAASWHEPHQIAAWALLLFGLVYLMIALRRRLRLAIFERFFDRALLQGALAGFGLASLFFGPGGAVFWVFWPLCGLFFDLLTPREHAQTPIAAELPAPELARFEAAP